MAINPNTTFTSGAVLTADQMNRLPWGIVAAATPLATSQGSIGGSLTDVTGQSVTWTAIATRTYILVAQASHFASGGAPAAAIAIATSANVEVATAAGASNGGYYTTENVMARVSGISGSVTYKMRAQAIGAGTITVVGTATSAPYSTQLFVMDIGPA